MIPRKPYVPKPMIHSPREEGVLKNIMGYLIRTFHNDGQYRLRSEARVHDPGVALSALLLAKRHNVRCLIYAIGEAYQEECLALVDESILRSKL